MKSLKDIKNIVSKFNVKPGPEMRSKVLGEALEIQRSRNEQSFSGTYTWRTIMNSKITKLATATVIIIVAVIGLSQFGSSFESVAWADVLENIRSSKTLTVIVRATEQGPPVVKVMVIDPHLLRFEFLSEEHVRREGGDILIVDTGKWNSLVLDTVNKTATVSTGPADKEMLGIYDTLRNFRGREDFTVEEIGHRQVGDKQAVGFKLKKYDENREIMVWADPETILPILIEESLENQEGQVVRQFVITDIVFDAELDVSLFSVKPPEGYALEEVDYGPRIAAAKRTQSMARAFRILMACKKYVAEHDGQWPDSLQDLAKYGVNNKILVNPRQPALEVGYIYLKPPASPSESRIVLYEAYDSWSDGINVGFADGHIEFIKDESDFKNHLGKN